MHNFKRTILAGRRGENILILIWNICGVILIFVGELNFSIKRFRRIIAVPYVEESLILSDVNNYTARNFIAPREGNPTP